MTFKLVILTMFIHIKNSNRSAKKRIGEGRGLNYSSGHNLTIPDHVNKGK